MNCLTFFPRQNYNSHSLTDTAFSYVYHSKDEGGVVEPKMHRGIYERDLRRSQSTRAAEITNLGSKFHSRNNVPASSKERSGVSAAEAAAGRRRALERIKMDSSRSPRMTSGTPARTRQKHSFHKDVSRMRAAMVSPNLRSHSKFDNHPHDLRRKYDKLTEPIKLWLTRVLSRLMYKHMRYYQSTLIQGFHTWHINTKKVRLEENLLEKYPQHIRNRLLAPVKVLRSRLIGYSSKLRDSVIKVKILRCWHEYVNWTGNSAHRKIANRHYFGKLYHRVFTAIKLYSTRKQKIKWMILQKTRHAKRAHQGHWFRKWVQYTCQVKYTHIIVTHIYSIT